MVGQWQWWLRDGPKGELWWGFHVDDEGFEQFETWDELQRRYFEAFHGLRDNGVLRSAFLRNEKGTVHVWPEPSA